MWNSQKVDLEGDKNLECKKKKLKLKEEELNFLLASFNSETTHHREIKSFRVS